MNREVLFRVWDIEDEKMSYNAQNTYDYGCNGDNNIPEERFADLLNNNNYVVEEYVGIISQTEKYVYEGDIICINGYNYPIIFKDGSFGIEMGDKIIPLCILIANGFWINPIGNIHENKELLNN